MKWTFRAGALAIALVACTSPNPNYVAGGGGGDGGVGDGSPGDGAPTDGAPGGDLMAVCTAGQRICLAQTGSAACDQGQYKLDRKCPNLSTCQAGYCQPPPASGTSLIGAACDTTGAPQENMCFSGNATDTLSCQPFVDAGGQTVSWFCDKAVGSGLPGTACTKGDDCRSGFCGSNGTCFRACLDQTDCPFMGSSGQMYRCENVTITVEGVQVQEKSCIP